VLTLETPRLIFAPIPVAVMRERLSRSNFVADVWVDDAVTAAMDGCLRVRFPEEWPGEDVLTMLPIWIARHERLPAPGLWCDGVIVRRTDRLAVGSMGFKAQPDATGTVEIGYTVNASLRGRGYATEMAGALVAWALRQPEVRRVIAECRESNIASVRVLEKVHFHRAGRRSGEDGDLLLWEHRVPGVEGPPPAADDAARGLRDRPTGPG
jgi:ribosomal-protein-alanine N-acetyltransferase